MLKLKLQSLKKTPSKHKFDPKLIIAMLSGLLSIPPPPRSSTPPPPTHTPINTVQRRAARYVLHNCDQMISILQKLKWLTLENGRIQSSLILLYKLQYSLIFVDHHHQHHTRKRYQFLTLPSNTVTHSSSFFPTTIRHWDQLPLELRQGETLDSFKSGLLTLNQTP